MSPTNAPAARIAEHAEVPYQVSELKRRTPTILEVSLRPLTAPLHQPLAQQPTYRLHSRCAAHRRAALGG